MERRNFLKTLASLAAVGAVPGVAAAAGRTLGTPSAGDVPGPAAGVPRTMSTANFALELNGTDVGFVQSVEGGDAVAEVLVDGTSGGFTGKRLGSLSYEPLKVVLNAPLHPDLTKYINESFAGGRGARGGAAIIGYDLNYKAISYRELSNVVLTELAIERLDAADAKNAVSFSLSLQPETVRTSDKAGSAAKVGAKQKAASNFRFTVAGLEDASDGVAAIEMPTAKLKPLTKGAAGSGKYDLSTFTVDVSVARAKPYLDWFERFAIKRGGEETTAKLELLGPDLKTVLYTVSLTGVGISALRTMKHEAGSDKIARMQATLYAEQMSFQS